MQQYRINPYGGTRLIYREIHKKPQDHPSRVAWIWKLLSNEIYAVSRLFDRKKLPRIFHKF